MHRRKSRRRKGRLLHPFLLKLCSFSWLMRSNLLGRLLTFISPVLFFFFIPLLIRSHCPPNCPAKSLLKCSHLNDVPTYRTAVCLCVSLVKIREILVRCEQRAEGTSASLAGAQKKGGAAARREAASPAQGRLRSTQPPNSRYLLGRLFALHID